MSEKTIQNLKQSIEIALDTVHPFMKCPRCCTLMKRLAWTNLYSVGSQWICPSGDWDGIRAVVDRSVEP